MQTPPSLKKSDSWGYDKHGVNTRETTADPVKSLHHVETQHPSDLRPGFSQTVHNVELSEPSEVTRLREAAGFNTKGKVITKPAGPATERERIVGVAKRNKGSRCSDWGGGVVHEGEI
jgi:hypothetical protein